MKRWGRKLRGGEGSEEVGKEKKEMVMERKKWYYKKIDEEL